MIARRCKKIAYYILTLSVCNLVCAISSFAQEPYHSPVQGNFLKLTVKFDKYATGTETKGAGTIQLPELPGYFVHVPTSCVGTVKCPLIVVLHGARSSGGQEVYKLISPSEQNGMILLAPDADKPDRWDLMRNLDTVKKTVTTSGIKVTDFKSIDIPKIDSSIKIVLQRYSIDTSKVALVGWGVGGSYAQLIGLKNPLVFSRVIISSPHVSFDNSELDATGTKVYFAGGIVEDSMLARVFTKNHEVQKTGVSSQIQIAMRDSEAYPEEQALLLQRLKQSWVDSNSAVDHIATYPILNNEIMEKVITFQQAFKSPRNSMIGSVRWDSQVSLPLKIGSAGVYVVVTNIPNAVKDVKARGINLALKDVGVSAQDMMSYRLAIIAAKIADEAGKSITIDSGSTLSKNLTYLRANKEMLSRLEKSWFWMTP